MSDRDDKHSVCIGDLRMHPTWGLYIVVDRVRNAPGSFECRFFRGDSAEPLVYSWHKNYIEWDLLVSR